MGPRRQHLMVQPETQLPRPGLPHLHALVRGDGHQGPASRQKLDSLHHLVEEAETWDYIQAWLIPTNLNRSPILPMNDFELFESKLYTGQDFVRIQPWR